MTADPHAVLVSLLTPPGRGALAVVGVAGPRADAVVDREFVPRSGRPLAARDEGAIAFGAWRTTGEDVVVVRRTRDVVEVHCHGGLAAASAVIASLIAHGAGDVPWPQWLAATGGSQAVGEAHEALAIAGGPAASRILARQAAGALDADLDRIARLRAAGDHGTAEAAIARLLRASRVGLRLTRPWRVVVAGVVNAGKSSLVNALAGHARSIVSPEPGTTRDVVTTRLVIEGWEVDLVDTAGLRGAHEAAGAVERAGIARAEAACADADLVLRAWPADVGRPACPTPGEILVISKMDLAPAGTRPPPHAVPTSAATGAGIADLATAIVTALVPEARTDPELLAGGVPFTPRQVQMIEAIGDPRRPPEASRTP